MCPTTCSIEFLSRCLEKVDCASVVLQGRNKNSFVAAYTVLLDIPRCAEEHEFSCVMSNRVPVSLSFSAVNTYPLRGFIFTHFLYIRFCCTKLRRRCVGVCICRKFSMKPSSTFPIPLYTLAIRVSCMIIFCSPLYFV
jgi:hypothetical protein